MALALQSMIAKGLTGGIVPLFFLLSGYLFFQGSGQPGSREAWQARLLSRTRTLLVPMIAWNGLVLAAVAAMQVIRPGLAPLGLPADLLSQGPDVMLAALLGIGRAPVVYPFWFIRDLVLLTLATPLLYASARMLPALLGVLAGAWAWGWQPVQVPSPGAMLFFGAGCLMGMRGTDLFALDRWSRPLLGLTLLAGGLRLIPVGQAMGLGVDVTDLALRLGVLASMGAMLGLTRDIAARPCIAGALQRLAASSFFVFAAHEPALTALRQLTGGLAGPVTPWTRLAMFLAVPAVLVTGLVLMHRVVAKRLPRLNRLITGGY